MVADMAARGFVVFEISDDAPKFGRPFEFGKERGIDEYKFGLKASKGLFEFLPIRFRFRGEVRSVTGNWEPSILVGLRRLW